MEEEISVLEEVKKNLKSKKLVFGTETTIKNMKLGKVSKVFVSTNAPAGIKQDLDHYAKLAGVQIISAGMQNNELGIYCKKSHLVSVIGLLK